MKSLALAGLVALASGSALPVSAQANCPNQMSARARVGWGEDYYRRSFSTGYTAAYYTHTKNNGSYGKSYALAEYGGCNASYWHFIQCNVTKTVGSRAPAAVSASKTCFPWCFGTWNANDGRRTCLNPFLLPPPIEIDQSEAQLTGEFFVGGPGARAQISDESQLLVSARRPLAPHEHPSATVRVSIGDAAGNTIAEGSISLRVTAGFGEGNTAHIEGLGIFEGLPLAPEEVEPGIFRIPISLIGSRVDPFLMIGSTISVETEAVPPIAANCDADVDDGSGTGRGDGGVTLDDLLYYMSIFDAGSEHADMDDGTGDGVPDGGVGIDDLLYYLQRFDQGC